MRKEFAGAMNERVTLLKPTAGRDALGDAGGDWTMVDLVWARVVPAATGPDHAGDTRAGLPRWRMWMRPCAVAVGDRIERVNGVLDIVEVTADPAMPDRVTILGEERR